MLQRVSAFCLRQVASGARGLHYPTAAGPSARSIRLSWSKDIMNKVVPFTGDLIGTNQISFDGAAVRYHSESLEPLMAGPEHPRSPEHSWVEIILPFSDHLKLRDDMMLKDHKAVRYGKLFEILDSLAADVAMRHTGGRDAISGKYSMTIVTAAIDRMHIYKDIDVMNDIVLRGYIGHVGRSSMEICIDILSTVDEVLAETMFIMVARDPSGAGAVPVPQLSMDTPESKRLYIQGELRAKARKEKRSLSLSKNAPLSSEIELIHLLYLQSVALKQQKDKIVKSTMLKGGNKCTDLGSASSIEVKWMKDTIFKNVYFMYPQDRNLHGNIFGGHILRRAFEAARVTASIFFGTEDKVAFKAVDEIHFVKPIPVGCIVEFTSTVTYSEMNVCVINVRAATIDVTSGVKDTTNSFNYMFYVPMKYVSLDNTTDDATIQRSGVDIKQTSCAIMENGIDTATVETLQSPSSNCIQRMKLPKVVPREYYEIVQYLEGRRSLRHMLNETNKSNISSARFAQLVSKS